MVDRSVVVRCGLLQRGRGVPSQDSEPRASYWFLAPRGGIGGAPMEEGSVVAKTGFRSGYQLARHYMQLC